MTELQARRDTAVELGGCWEVSSGYSGDCLTFFGAGFREFALAAEQGGVGTAQFGRVVLWFEC